LWRYAAAAAVQIQSFHDHLKVEQDVIDGFDVEDSIQSIQVGCSQPSIIVNMDLSVCTPHFATVNQ